MNVGLENLWIGGVVITAALAMYVLLGLYGLANRLKFSRSSRELYLRQAEILLERVRDRIESDANAIESWTGNRKFEVSKRVYECDDESVCSFSLVPHDHRQLPRFFPGQFLTFDLKISRTETVTRCYSLSDVPNPKEYRVSIKRVPPPNDSPEVPPGVSSNHFHDEIKVGDILDVRAPSGKFWLDLTEDRPVVLVGGGIGITPVLSMVNSIVASGGSRETWLFYGVRNHGEHCMQEHLDTLRAANPNVHVVICYSNPNPADRLGTDYDYAERISVELFRRVLPSNNYQFYMCGPPPMMESLIEDLGSWGVPDKDILRESFGPASGRKATKPNVVADASGPSVKFKRSGTAANWDDHYGNLVMFAEANGIEIPYACLAGNCGTCLTTIIDGEVEYPGGAPAYSTEDGTCLTCSCIPLGPVTLDV